MSKQQINTRNIVLILMIIAAAAMRLVSYKYPYILSNFTPVGAIALFGGYYFADKWKAYLVPVLTLLVSDVVINYLYTSKWTLITNSTIWLCLCFCLMVFAGTLFKKITFANSVCALFAPVLIHWLIMDLPFLYGTYYTHDIAGYMKSLTLALPFELNMLLGDIFYGVILFGGFELAKRKYTFLSRPHELAM